MYIYIYPYIYICSTLYRSRIRYVAFLASLVYVGCVYTPSPLILAILYMLCGDFASIYGGLYGLCGLLLYTLSLDDRPLL